MVATNLKVSNSPSGNSVVVGELELIGNILELLISDLRDGNFNILNSFECLSEGINNIEINALRGITDRDNSVLLSSYPWNV
jgi:hypothetical protein